MEPRSEIIKRLCEVVTCSRRGNGARNGIGSDAGGIEDQLMVVEAQDLLAGVGGADDPWTTKGEV